MKANEAIELAAKLRNEVYEAERKQAEIESKLHEERADRIFPEELARAYKNIEKTITDSNGRDTSTSFASNYSKNMRKVEAALREAGYHVTSRWIPSCYNRDTGETEPRCEVLDISWEIDKW